MSVVSRAYLPARVRPRRPPSATSAAPTESRRSAPPRASPTPSTELWTSCTTPDTTVDSEAPTPSIPGVQGAAASERAPSKPRETLASSPPRPRAVGGSSSSSSVSPVSPQRTAAAAARRLDGCAEFSWGRHARGRFGAGVGLGSGWGRAGVGLAGGRKGVGLRRGTRSPAAGGAALAPAGRCCCLHRRAA